jgi:GNAT superfamily N-acetyltransferase
MGLKARAQVLGTRLEAHGLHHTGTLAGMAADLALLPAAWPVPDGVVISMVGDAGTLRTWMHVAVAGFGFPPAAEAPLVALYDRLALGHPVPWRCYLAAWHGTPVATSALALRAGVAGIYWVATLPEARRQGIGAAVTLAALREARSQGYRLGVLQAGRMGHAIYRRLGFQDYCSFGMYRWPGDAGRITAPPPPA